MNSPTGARQRVLRTTLLTLALLAFGAAAAEAKAPRDFYGVMPQTALTTEDFDRMAEAKVGTLRFEVSWFGIDPTEAEGDLNWSGIDATMTQLAKHGIEPLPFIFGTPIWAAKADGYNCAGAKCVIYGVRKPAGIAAWKTFVGELVDRYGPTGKFWEEHPELPKQPIEEYQIWNEQNSPSFYGPKPNPASYAKLLKAADQAIAGSDPSADVVLGGMFVSPLQGRKPAQYSYEYLADLYDIKGAKKTFDGVAAHPYAAKMNKVTQQVELLRDAMKDGGDSGADLWITEIGWASDGPQNPLVRGEKGQAERVKEAYKFFSKKRGKWNVRAVVWYSWRDNPDSGGLCIWCPGSGLVTKDLTPKPSLKAFTKFTGGS